MRKEDKSTIIEQIAATVKEYSHFYLIDITAMNAAATSALRQTGTGRFLGCMVRPVSDDGTDSS